MVFRGVQSRTQNSIVLDYFQLWNYLKRNKKQAKLQLEVSMLEADRANTQYCAYS